MLGLLGIAGALTKATELAGPLLAGLLVFPTLGMAAAPFNSWAAQRAALPPDLRARRTTEWKRTRERRAFVRGATVGGLAAVGGVVLAAVGLMYAPSDHSVQTPSLLQPASGQHSTPASGRPSPSPRASSPSPSSSTPVTPTPTPSATTPSVTPTPTSSPSATTSGSAPASSTTPAPAASS
jgi:hypothetical protein